MSMNTQELDGDRVTSSESPLRRPIFSVSNLRDFGVVGMTLALAVFLSFASETFLTTTNLLNIADQWSAVGIIACAATIVIIAGGFDLTPGAVFALSGIAAAKVADDLGVLASFGAALLVGAAVGLVFGVLTTFGRVNSFIGTLAGSILIRGIALVWTGGYLLTVEDPDFTYAARGELFGLKPSILIFATFALFCWLLLTRTTFGRYVFAVGGNLEAAKLSGIRVNWVKGSTFILSGVAAAIAGFIVASRVSTAQADAGMGIEFTAITAVVIGGTSIYGGAGAIWRTLLGVLLLALIGNGFTLLNLDPTYQRITEGGIILVAVAVDALVRRERT